jgi:hypothetical protein
MHRSCRLNQKEKRMKHTRNRYQHGSLTMEQRKDGLAVWIYRWRQPVGHGKTVKRKKILGTTEKIKTQSAAEKAAAALRVDINALSNAPATVMSIAEIVEHFTLVELPAGSRTHRTRETYSSYIANIILPKWGAYHLADVKTVAVERWLSDLPGAPATKAKIRAVLSMLFRHAIRYEFATTNPISLVRQSAKRMIDPVILEVPEVRDLLAQLVKQPEPSFTLVFIAVVSGLRRGELFGLNGVTLISRAGRSMSSGLWSTASSVNRRRLIPEDRFHCPMNLPWCSSAGERSLLTEQIRIGSLPARMPSVVSRIGRIPCSTSESDLPPKQPASRRSSVPTAFAERRPRFCCQEARASGPRRRYFGMRRPASPWGHTLNRYRPNAWRRSRQLLRFSTKGLNGPEWPH